MTLVPLPAFADNYIWMLQDGTSAIVVDPGDAKPVFDALGRSNLKLAAILVTHHHADHVGGVDELRAATGAPVYGPAGETIPEPYAPLAQGDTAQVLGLRFSVLDVPGHTAGHIAYYLAPDASWDGVPLLFCGDTLFSGGCGRLFEGTPAQMLASLDRLSQLPGETLVCGGHEYTEANGRFARTIEPANPELQQRLQEVAALRRRLQPTLPVPLARELATNPFLRTDTEAVIAWCRQQGSGDGRVARFATVRSAKDGFHG